MCCLHLHMTSVCRVSMSQRHAKTDMHIMTRNMLDTYNRHAFAAQYTARSIISGPAIAHLTISDMELSAELA